MRTLRLQERCARALLLLTLLHTVPVIWITPVAGGTAPTALLLGFGLASLFTFEREGLAIALFALGPALIYCGIAWSLAWLLARSLEKMRLPLRAGLLAAVVVAAMVSVYAPIYIAGSHNGSRSANLFELFGNVPHARVLLEYWIGLHAVLIALYAGHLLRSGHPAIGFVERWRKPAVTTMAAAMFAAVLVGYYPMLICWPLAELGSGRAALCVARSDQRDQRDWYQRAAEHGQSEAIAWMIAHTSDRERKLYWLRKGAELGHAEIQFALYERLTRAGGTSARGEAEVWLRRSAEGDHVPAQMVMVDMLSRAIYASGSSEQLTERNRWLERAARLGARDATLHLARHYVDGSMGYPADLRRARALYRDLADVDQPTRYERMLGLDAAYYAARLAELDAWKAGLKSRDPMIARHLAEQYLRSQLPGPGVRQRGLQLMEQLAEAGDTAARDALIMMLRTGSGGVEKDLDTARRWLIIAAEAGEPDAMERVASNYASGREGFTVDYPEAQRWLRAAIRELDRSDIEDAQSRTAALRRELAYIDRRAEQAGGTLLGAQALEELGRRQDAESKYQYAEQLLAGHSPHRRAEAIARLQEASSAGHAEAAWRLFQIHERGFPAEINQTAALNQLKRAAENHHFNAIRELAIRYEYGKRGLPADLSRAISLYENALAAGRDNRYGWNLDPDNFNHFKWLESRLRQARLKQTSQAKK